MFLKTEGLSEAAHGEQLDIRRDKPASGCFGAHQIGGEVFLVVVAEDGNDGAVFTEPVLSECRTEKIRAGGNADSHTEIAGQFLGHDNGIPVVNGNDIIEKRKIDDGRNEFIGDTLYPVAAHLAAGG